MFRLSAVIVSLLALALSGCSSLSEPAWTSQGDVSVRFVLKNGQTPVDCRHPLTGLGQSHVDARLKDARFYISDLRLISDRGDAVSVRLDRNNWQYSNVALLDFEDAGNDCKGGTPGLNDRVSGSVPAGRYVGVSFVLGVPVNGQDESGAVVSLNHSSTETSPPPLDLAAMGWSWQAGRKFLKVEVVPEGGVTLPSGRRAQAWFVHLGSTGCIGNPATGETVRCANENRLTVRFPAFDPARQQVVLDIGVLFAGSDLNRDEGGAVGCMSGPDDPECKAIFQAIGLHLKESAPGAADSGKPIRADGVSSLFWVEDLP